LLAESDIFNHIFDKKSNNRLPEPAKYPDYGGFHQEILALLESTVIGD